MEGSAGDLRIVEGGNFVPVVMFDQNGSNDCGVLAGHRSAWDIERCPDMGEHDPVV
jgi:hypothetical protein